MTRENWQKERTAKRNRLKTYKTLKWGSDKTIALDSVSMIDEPTMNVGISKNTASYDFEIIIDGIKETIEFELEPQTKVEVYDAWYSFLGFGGGKVRDIPWTHQDYFGDETEVTKIAKDNYQFIIKEFRQFKALVTH